MIYSKEEIEALRREKEELDVLVAAASSSNKLVQHYYESGRSPPIEETPLDEYEF